MVSTTHEYMGVSQLLGARAPAAPTKVFAYDGGHDSFRSVYGDMLLKPKPLLTSISHFAVWIRCSDRGLKIRFLYIGYASLASVSTRDLRSETSRVNRVIFPRRPWSSAAAVAIMIMISRRYSTRSITPLLWQILIEIRRFLICLRWPVSPYPTGAITMSEGLLIPE